MFYKVPTLNPDLQLIAPRDDLEPHRLGLRGARRSEIVPTAIVASLFFVDSRRSIEGIHELAQLHDIDCSLEAVERGFEDLHRLGLVSLRDPREQPHERLPGTHHHCEGCGRSCEGHLVGPLPPSEVQTIRDILPWLRELAPDALADARVFMQLPRQAGVYLRLTEGRCVFLAPDKRCLIHAHFGPAFKPLICRMFPYLRVLTEDGYRLAVSPGCARHHAHAEPALGPVETLDSLDTASPVGDMVVARPLSSSWAFSTLHALEDPEHYRVRERSLITWLSAPRDLRALIARLTRRPPPDTPTRRALSASVARALQRILAHLPAEIRRERSFVAHLLVHHGPFAEDLRGLIADMEWLQHAPLTGLPLDAAFEAAVLDSLRRFVFLREGLDAPSFEHAVATHLVGWLLALWSTRQLAPGPRHDRCCERHAVWHRAIAHSGLSELLFDHHPPALLFDALLEEPGADL